MQPSEAKLHGRRDLVALGLVTCMGALLRLVNPGAAQYGPDEVTLTALARGIASGTAFPTGFNASVSIPNGPVAPYLVAPIAYLSTSHFVLLAWLTAVNVAAIPLLFSLARDLFGTRAGLLAATLYAANPWLVVFGRWLEPNAAIGPAAILFLWALHRSVETSSGRAWLLAGAAVALSLQTHLSSLANGLALVGILPVANRLSKKGALLAMGTVVVLVLPWIIGSVWPSLPKGGFGWVPGSRALSSFSLEQALRIVTGEAYQAIAGAPLHYVDASAAPFQAIDWSARTLAVLGWGRLLWLGWKERLRAPAVSATCLVAACMVLIPVLVLARPAEIGNVAEVYVHEFINVAPPLMLGMASLTAVSIRLLGSAAAVLCTVIAASHLALAVPFHLTPVEEWRPRDFSIPYGLTEPLLRAMRDRAIPVGAAVMVGGEEYAEQGKLAQTALRIDYDRTRLHDGRDGIVFWADAPQQLLVTTNDQHSMSRFLRKEFGLIEVFMQALPGTRWTRRIFEVTPADLDRWAAVHMDAVAQSEEASPVRYERAALLPGRAPGDGPTVAILWRFQGEPPEPFFTDVVLTRGGEQVYREEHVAYPVAFWERDDWQRLRMLNLFDVPPATSAVSVDGLRLEHRGILSGKRLVPPVSVAFSVAPGEQGLGPSVR